MASGGGDAVTKGALRLAVLAFALSTAYQIRLFAIKTFGLVIHEFDPWFNFRATQYLADNGWTAFFSWFDYKVWYPLGRPVGTTIYPGMQIASVTIWESLKLTPWPMSLNDVCCYVPAWFGVSATVFLGLLTYECSGSANAGVVAAMIMAIIPAHLMRSVGGGYDNESVALTAMTSTFFFWNRSLRDQKSWPLGIVTGLLYVFMVAAWGGYVFVLNMIAMHAGFLMMTNYSPNLHRAYSLFYVIGTFGATHVPVVGWTPLKSLEQLGALAVFACLQVCFVVDVLNKGKKLSFVQTWVERIKVGLVGLLAVILLGYITLPEGYFGPFSARIRGLFVKHTRTGNPLVDSVAEHQPASANAYYQYMHQVCLFAPIGFAIAAAKVGKHFVVKGESFRMESNFFLVLYGLTAYYFCSKMVRLIILMGPIASALGGIAIAAVLEWSLDQFWTLLPGNEQQDKESTPSSRAAAATAKAGTKSPADKGSSKKSGSKKSKKADKGSDAPLFGPILDFYNSTAGRSVRTAVALLLVIVIGSSSQSFYKYCHIMAEGMSQPSIMFKATLRDGTPVIVDDYREGYWWLRDNTPEDARVMAWWDYGYQITGIGNRTTIADGNTWNHEHIATLGKILTAPVDDAHDIAKHLADYILVWTGGGGDDLAKSPHMARIGNSVYDDICPGDPTCRSFGFVDQRRTPTPMMANSLLYNLHGHNQVPGVKLDPRMFKEVFTSKYNKIRIFQIIGVDEESRRWVADPANRLCDVPGSWYCPGQYPPAIMDLISRRRNFAQLEDFNRKKDAKDDEYQRQYMARMAGKVPEGEKAKQQEQQMRQQQQQQQQQAAAAAAAAAAAPKKKREGPAPWADSADTTRMWGLINAGDAESIGVWLTADPDAVNMRSGDGRGPLWWAYENGRTEIIKLLRSAGGSEEVADAAGKRPSEMAK